MNKQSSIIKQRSVNWLIRCIVAVLTIHLLLCGELYTQLRSDISGYINPLHLYVSGSS